MPSHRRNREEKDRDMNRAEKTAANWAAVRRMGRVYFWAALLALASLLFLAGYSMGLVEQCLPRKESSNAATR